MLDALLEPISADQPAGVDQSGEPEWQALKEARRADDTFSRGQWDRPLKEADWHAVKEIATELLSKKTKDLRLAVFLTEANVNLSKDFVSLGESFGLIRGLLSNFWDNGLFPPLEDGDPQYRAQALDWLGHSDKLPDAIKGVAITKRSDGGPDYSWRDFDNSRTVGWEKDLRTSTGDIDEAKAERRATAIANGQISREMFEAAVSASPRASIEAISQDLETAWTDFQALDKEIDEKFKDDGPGLQGAKSAFEECRNLIRETIKKKREQEPDPNQAQEAAADGSSQGVGGPDFEDGWGSSGGGGSWQAAEALIKGGNLKDGLAEMTRLAAAEHGRARFQRKLRLAETCLRIKRDRIGVAILEELAKEIDQFHLDQWESAELLGRVWGRLYRCSKSGNGDSGRGTELFDRLCRLDPWQALRWDD